MKCSELIRKVEKRGWTIIRQKGSHRIYEHPELEGLVVVPDHGSKEVGKGLAAKIMKQAGI